MNNASRPSDTLAGRAVGMAAGCRDVMRAAQFYTRDMSYVDGRDQARRTASPFLSRLVARAARLVDRFMTWSANTAIALVLPSWRHLPSPFAPGMVAEVAEALSKDRLLHNPLFNSYFYRAAVAITTHYAASPNLLLEHRVDAARHRLTLLARESAKDNSALFLAQALLALVEAAPVARVGPAKATQRGRSSPALLSEAEPNLVVFSIACLALFCADEGQPSAIQNEEEFFAVIGALIHPRLPLLQQLVANRDVAGLMRAFTEIKNLY